MSTASTLMNMVYTCSCCPRSQYSSPTSSEDSSDTIC